MLQVLTKLESDRMNDNLIQWVTETLESDKSTYLYNILMQVKRLMEYMAESKLTWKERHKLFTDGFNFAEEQRKMQSSIKRMSKINKKK